MKHTPPTHHQINRETFITTKPWSPAAESDSDEPCRTLFSISSCCTYCGFHLRLLLRGSNGLLTFWFAGGLQWDLTQLFGTEQRCVSTSLVGRGWKGKGWKYLLGPEWLLGRIRSVPGNNTAPLIISPMMHPTDHMSTENKNEMKVNKKTETEQQINEKTYPIMLQHSACLLLSAAAFLPEHTSFMTTEQV